MAKYKLGRDVLAGDADVAILAEPVKALGQWPGTADLGGGRDRQIIDHRQIRLGLQAAPDADHPNRGPEVDPVGGGWAALHDPDRQRHGRHLLDRVLCRPLTGTGPPASSSATGPVTATVSSAIPPKIEWVTTTSSPWTEIADAPVRTGACSRAAAAPSSTRPAGPSGAEQHTGIGRDDVRDRARVGLHRHVARLAEPDHPVDPAAGDRLRHGARTDDGRGDLTAEAACVGDQGTDRRVAGDDDPRGRTHGRVISFVVVMIGSETTTAAGRRRGVR